MNKSNKHISIFNCKIYYEDVDIGGYCYHSKYLNFCERARSEIFFSKDLLPVQNEYHFIVKNLQADFITPGLFGNKIKVLTSVQEHKNASITLYQEIHSEDNNILFHMNITLVCLRKNKITKIPDFFNNIFISS